MPGADPLLVQDPVARKKYEYNIAENDEKLANIQRQAIFRRIEDDIVKGTSRAICSYYQITHDKHALRRMATNLISSHERKIALLEMIEKLN